MPVGAGRRFSLDFRSGGRIIANKRRTWRKIKSCATQLHSCEKNKAALDLPKGFLPPWGGLVLLCVEKGRQRGRSREEPRRTTT